MFSLARSQRASSVQLCLDKDEVVVNYFPLFYSDNFTLVYCESVAIPALAIDEKPIRERKVITTVQDAFQILQRFLFSV